MLCLSLFLWAIACGPPTLGFRPADATDVPAGVVHDQSAFVARDNTGLYEQSWRPAQTSPRAILIVMHGLKDHSARYADFGVKLALAGWAVHAFDMRGHARSEGERVMVDRFDDYVGDLETFAERVRAREGDKPLFLLGHSMGGAIVALYALEGRRPQPRGIVLSAPALRANVGFLKKTGTKLVSALSPHAGVFNLDLDDFSRDPKVVEACKNDPLVYQGGAPAHTAKELLRALSRIDDEMENMTTPFFVMHGDADKVTDPQGSRDLYAGARATDKTLKIYPGLVHDLLHEPEKDQVMADVTAWMEARAK